MEINSIHAELPERHAEPAAVFVEAMNCGGVTWLVISEDEQERCLAWNFGRVRFVERLTPHQ
jgi:hypothetical protein